MGERRGVGASTASVASLARDGVESCGRRRTVRSLRCGPQPQKTAPLRARSVCLRWVKYVLSLASSLSLALVWPGPGALRRSAARLFRHVYAASLTFGPEEYPCNFPSCPGDQLWQGILTLVKSRWLVLVCSVVRSVVLQFNPGNKFACPVSSASHGLALMFFATRFSLARLLYYGGVGRCVL